MSTYSLNCCFSSVSWDAVEGHGYSTPPGCLQASRSHNFWLSPASLCRHLRLSGPTSSLPTLAERAIFTYLWVGLVSSWSRKPMFLQFTLRWEGAKTNVMEMAQSYGQGEGGIEWLLATARCGLDSYHQPITLLSLVNPLLLP